MNVDRESIDAERVVTPVLTDEELLAFVRRTFGPRDGDRDLAILYDLPDGNRPDNPAWSARRALARAWAARLAAHRDDLGLPTCLYSYTNVRANNADLPETMVLEIGDERTVVSTEAMFERSTLVIALTELSATAPLKVAAPRHGLRAATMPGFSREMIPALRIDAAEVDRRCRILASHLDLATGAELKFRITDPAWPGEDSCSLHLDLRHRGGHSSGGLLVEPGTAGNVPSGESYIVPYEGEHPGDPSRSRGSLPVQFDDGIVVYRIERNWAVEVNGSGPAVERERELLHLEPAYGNIAELGLGILGAFGVHPIGVVLLDEKLGPHIAFGRSNHFGGQIGPADFRSPDRVVHIDRVYLAETQPDVLLEELVLQMPNGELPLISDREWTLPFGTTGEPGKENP